MSAPPEATVPKQMALRTGLLQNHHSGVKPVIDLEDRLLRAARDAESVKSPKYKDTVTIIRDDHVEAVRASIRSSEIVETVTGAVLQQCQDLNVFLAAAQQIGEISPKSYDKIVSKGELLSAAFLAALFQDQGIDSEVVDLSDIVGFAAHDGLDQDFYAQLAAEVGSRISACGEKVPVVTGFFGAVPGGLLCQIGRGYTDLCAALVAIGLGAKELQVWKEVDGIFTAFVHLSAHHGRCSLCSQRSSQGSYRTITAYNYPCRSC